MDGLNWMDKKAIKLVSVKKRSRPTGREQLIKAENTDSVDEAVECLKFVSATFLLVCFLSLNESTCQSRKNAFYLTSKTLFVLEKIKF